MAKLSILQRQFCEAIHSLARGGLIDGKRHIVLDAKAGSGKTFTITWSMQYIPTAQRVVALMFNKRNAEDIQPKLPQTDNVEARTTHSLGGRVMRVNRAGQLDDNKMWGIIRDLDLSPNERKFMPQIRQLVSVAKAVGLVPDGCQARGLVPDSIDVWSDLIERYSIEFDEPWEEEAAVSYARIALEHSLKGSFGFSGSIDFDDMLYVPIVKEMSFPKYDWVFIDEAQDINPVQREMVKRALKPGGHLVAVGDPHQAIYGFRGADSESMARIAQEMNAHTMPLSICYRCDKSIVREAMQVVPDIQCDESRADGSVTYGLPVRATRSLKLEGFTPDAAILCPRNAPLVRTAFGLIRSRIACHMIGRDFAEGLVNLLEKLNASTAREAEIKLDAYLRQERSRFEEDEKKLQALEDKCGTLRVFLSEAAPNQTMQRIIASIESLFDENAKGMLTLCSIHRAKGGEWPRVFLMDHEILCEATVSFRGKARKLQEWEVEQRRNLLYVAITRAAHELVYVTSDDMEKLFP